MVAIEREVPGTMARHWKKPTPRARFQPIASTPPSSCEGRNRSSAIIATPPTPRATAIVAGENSLALIASWNRNPNTTAGKVVRNSQNSPRNPANPAGIRKSASRRNRRRYSTSTASMAPDWITTSKLSWNEASSHFSARTRCPVEEIGRYSVIPSTTPISAAIQFVAKGVMGDRCSAPYAIWPQAGKPFSGRASGLDRLRRVA